MITKEDAEKIAMLISNADGGGCISCQEGLCTIANMEWPGWEWSVGDDNKTHVEAT